MTSYVVLVRIMGERAYSLRVDNARDVEHAHDVVRKVVPTRWKSRARTAPTKSSMTQSSTRTARR